MPRLLRLELQSLEVEGTEKIQRYGGGFSLFFRVFFRYQVGGADPILDPAHLSMSRSGALSTQIPVIYSSLPGGCFTDVLY